MPEMALALPNVDIINHLLANLFNHALNVFAASPVARFVENTKHKISNAFNGSFRVEQQGRMVE
nr:hypothetical protein [Candidatus Enterovibrio escacola]